MRTIEIDWLHDSHECETCGYSSAYGAKVSMNGETLLDLEPVARCFDGQDYPVDVVYKAILSKLGYAVEEEIEGPTYVTD